MGAGIGVDMLEIARMERVMRRRPSFLTRVFTDEERAYCNRRARPAEHYAARWAAREAVLKALGIGFAGGVGFKDVSVVNDESGRPQALLAGRALEVAREQGVQEVALSLSHTREVAVANAVMVTDEVRPRIEERADPERELLQSFRQARVVIDELERQQLSLLDLSDGTADDDAVDEGTAGADADDEITAGADAAADDAVEEAARPAGQAQPSQVQPAPDDGQGPADEGDAPAPLADSTYESHE